MTWVKLRHGRRKQNSYHAVYVEARGGYWTYCGEFSTYAGVRDRWFEAEEGNPPRRCGCCRARVLHSYLVPAKLLAIARETRSVAA